MTTSAIALDAPFVVAVVTMPLASLVIGTVYLLQYRVGERWRPLFVSAHFVAVSAIICTYSLLAVARYEDTIWQVPGAIVFVVGSFVFWYSVRCHPTCLVPDAEGGVVRAGPYNHIRHPIYSGGLLGALGLIAVAPAWDLAVVWIVLLVSLVVLAEFEERELLDRFSSSYADYARRTRLMIPGVL